ncbi:trimethylguanosine synthase, putative [Plasmodium sp. gorilla clade G3]|nr:trimethylguanosine synthase, putative [Plasmodium sp. gorilla clade G3]
MFKVRYENFNDIRNDTEMLNISFVVHPCYYSILDLEESELFNKIVYENFCKVAENVDIYDKNEYLSVYRRHDKKCRELHMLKSWELLKNTYRYKMPVIFKNLKDFDLYNMEKISYYSINYKKKNERNGNGFVVRNKKKINIIDKEKCFILDNHMIYSMTPEYIAKNISKNILLNTDDIMEGRKALCIKEDDKNIKHQKEVYDNCYYYKFDNHYNDNINCKDRYSFKCKGIYPIKKKRKIEPILDSNKKIDYRRKKKILIYLDPFAGAGGNCNHMNNLFTIGCDINFYRIKQCQHNCKFYNKNVDFILCDFLNLVTHFRKGTIDVIFFSIPWGGPKYKNKKNFELNSEIINNISVYKCIEMSLELTENLVFYLPRNVCMKELYYLYEYYKKLIKNKKCVKYENNDIYKYDRKKKKKKKKNDIELISNDKYYYEHNNKFQKKNNNILLELYINRTRCNYHKNDDNSINNFFYFFNEKCDLYDNKFIFSNVQNLFHINIDHCYHIYNCVKRGTNSYERQIYNIKEENVEEVSLHNTINNVNQDNPQTYDNDIYSYVDYVPNEEKEIKEKEKYLINYYYKNDGNINYPANKKKKKKKKKNIWAWHNTCMVLYLGNISSNIRNRKIINIKDVYYVDRKLSNILIDIEIDKRKCKHFIFSYHNFVLSQKKKRFYHIYKNKKELFNNKLYINKYVLIKKYIITQENILNINNFVMKKLYNIIEKIILLFFNNIKNMMGYEKISFLNKICIQLENVYDKILTENIDKHVDIKKYETYIYKDDDKKGQLCYIHLVEYFNIIIRKIKKEFLLLFSIYLYDISFMRYYFRHKNISIEKKKLSTKGLKKIHYNIIRILFNLLLYMKIYLNIVSNNIKLERYYNEQFIIDNMNIDNIPNNILNRCCSFIYSLRKKKNTNYNFRKNNVTSYMGCFKNFIKYIIRICINLELKENHEEEKISIKNMSNFFFRSLFNVERVDILINKINNNINNNNNNEEEEEDIKYYKYNLYLLLIHLFTKQFLYNSHVNTNLDYFNTLLFFYFNQVYSLSKYQDGYINIFVHFLNNFLYKNFFVKIT